MEFTKMEEVEEAVGAEAMRARVARQQRQRRGAGGTATATPPPRGRCPPTVGRRRTAGIPGDDQEIQQLRLKVGDGQELTET